MSTSTIQAGPIVVSVEERDGFITSVKLPFTAEEWVNIVSKEGQWLASCCSNISGCRDILISALREDGNIRPDGLRELVELLASHDGFEYLGAATFEAWQEEAKQIAESGDPFVKLGHIWWACKDRLRFDNEQPRDGATSDPHEALRVLRGESLALSWALIITPSETQKPCQDAQITLSVARLVPALKVLHARLEELAPPPFDGVAIVARESGEVVGAKRSELAIFRHAADALLVVGHLREAREKFALRNCRVSLAEGLVLGDEVAWPTPPEQQGEQEGPTQ